MGLLLFLFRLLWSLIVDATVSLLAPPWGAHRIMGISEGSWAGVGELERVVFEIDFQICDPGAGASEAALGAALSPKGALP